LPTPYDNPDYHAFIRHLRTEDSDLARLVIADWLEEREEAERAEFIRVHVEGWGCRTLVQFERCYDLMRKNGGTWLHRDLWPSHDPNTAGVTLWQSIYPLFTRGFVENVSCPLDWWLEHGPAVCRRHPVREVRITDRMPNLTIARERAMWHSDVIQEGYLYRLGYLDQFAASILPSVIYGHLVGRDTSWPVFPHCRYNTAADAVAALNAAALRWAEAEADR